MSQACGERVLFPAVRGTQADDLVVAPGFSCRHQIADFCDNRRSLHTAELLAMAGLARRNWLSLGNTGALDRVPTTSLDQLPDAQMNKPDRSTAEKIRMLLEEGRNFTYANFASKSEYGYPAAPQPSFVAWCTRVNNILRHFFAENSAPIRVLAQASAVVVLGNGSDKFDHMMALYLGALAAAADILDDDQFDELAISSNAVNLQANISNRVFVVHGHDEVAKTSLEVFLSEIGLEPIVLHRKADEGQTIIEKFEKHSDVGYAFILLTPDEVAYVVSEADKPDELRRKEYRARPNVIFEFGYFVGRLGRPRVCCLYRGEVALPSDVSGLLYKQFSRSVEEVAYGIIKELKAVGYNLRV